MVGLQDNLVNIIVINWFYHYSFRFEVLSVREVECRIYDVFCSRSQGILCDYSFASVISLFSKSVN